MAALPTHETLPADHKAAIRQMKQALRAQIGDVQAVFDKLSARISERLQEIETLKAAGQEVWPTVPFRDIAEGTVSDEQRAAIKRRGCAVIKGHFPREQALAWDTRCWNIWIATISTMFTKGLATASSVRWRLRARRSTRSTGRPRKCRRGRAMKWRRCNLSSTACGVLNRMANAGSIRTSA
ncbi:Protein of uncharacterised function (DUF1479) [Klebsiella pneumoniae]|nr:Protein of uncharacterised function (DUF1479) [Klebsiella pneumoniae]